MKCNKCIFAKDIDSDFVKCCNISADDYDRRLFTKWDGCKDGKASTVGLRDAERFSLIQMNKNLRRYED